MLLLFCFGSILFHCVRCFAPKCIPIKYGHKILSAAKYAVNIVA